VGINNFVLLLKVEDLVLLKNLSLLVLVFEILLVLRKHALWVRVAYKLIIAPGFPASFVTNSILD